MTKINLTDNQLSELKYHLADRIVDNMDVKQLVQIAFDSYHDYFDKLSEVLSKDSNIFISTGSTVTWAYQSFKIKLGQRFISANGHSPMGYALPAIIGSYYANQNYVFLFHLYLLYLYEIQVYYY